MPALRLGQIPMSTFPSGASNSLGAVSQIPALVQQTQYLSVNQPTSVPDCKLKSFSSEEWKVDVELRYTETWISCESCSKKYSRNSRTCPHCRRNNPTWRGLNNLSFGYSESIQCKHCRTIYVKNSGSCPGCGAAESESSADILTTIQKAVPRYIGHVTRSHQSQADTYDEFEKKTSICIVNDYDDYYEDGIPTSMPAFHSYSPQASVGASRPRSSANSTTSQIATEINAIRSILSGWQTLATEKKTKTNVW